jgi:drug/metabolite transporter (DMT)-like permease
MNIKDFGVILINTLLLVGGQFLWKFGMVGKKHSFDSVQSIIGLMLSPPILGGLLLYGVATVLWLYVLSRVPLSIAYPLQSLAYLFALVGSYYFFQEAITWMKVVGILFIMVGISFIGLTAK